ncbi:DUF6165 family protein [Pelagibacteraceae bacterium]|nr:DUF6165 family protein [Pelagibacteraceae bacterium]
MKVSIPVSVGELADKITILEIKSKKIKDRDSLYEINKELTLLMSIFTKKSININKIKSELDKLRKINKKLWIIEDKKRNHEKIKKFDSKFIELARNVYKLNDQRAMAKLNINKITKSNIIEIKSYN